MSCHENNNRQTNMPTEKAVGPTGLTCRNFEEKKDREKKAGLLNAEGDRLKKNIDVKMTTKKNSLVKQASEKKEEYLEECATAYMTAGNNCYYADARKEAYLEKANLKVTLFEKHIEEVDALLENYRNAQARAFTMTRSCMQGSNAAMVAKAKEALEEALEKALKF